MSSLWIETMIKPFIVMLSFLTFSFSNVCHGDELSIPSFSTAGFYAVPYSPRKVFNFNPGWRVYKGSLKNAYAINFDDSQWIGANLPHGIETLGINASGGRNYQGDVWYRKEFYLPESNGPKKTFIYFEAIMGHAQVWLNGAKVAEHFGGYLPFAVDISAVPSKDGKYVIAVLANNENNKLYLPGKPQEGLDFTYMGGIYRDTYLIQTSNVHVSLTELSDTVAGGGVFVATLDVNNNSGKANADLVIKTEVINSSNKAKALTVRSVLENAENKELFAFKQGIKIKAGQRQQITQEAFVKNVRLWHPDDPYLHFIRTDILEGGDVIDSMRTRIGIRLFEMQGAEGLFINKKWIGKKLLGVNRHQDYAYVGNALPNSGQWRDVKLLREGGSNIIRAGHYPMDPAFYDACDELGMLTTTANPGWHFFNFNSPIFEQRLYQDTRDLVRRDRNRPSILMWETALNETPTQPGHAMNTMHNIAHEEFPFPGMFTVTDHQEAVKGGLDIHYHGEDPNINSFNREYGDGYEVDSWKSQNAATRVPLEWGEKALLNQSLVQAEYLSNRYPTPKVRLGGAMWAGIDHQRGYHPDPFWGGQLNTLRLPKYTYYLYKSQYSSNFNLAGIETGPMLFIAHELTQISPSDVVIFSNVDEVAISFLDKTYGPIKPSSDPRFQHLPNPPFVFKDVYDFTDIRLAFRKLANKDKKAKLTANGYIDGKLVISEEKRYAQRTAAIKLSLDSQGVGLLADGTDFVPVRASIIDAQGAKKVLAVDDVYFSVEGPAEIICGLATDNNPADVEMGIASALVKTQLLPGTIKVSAFADGLEPDSITFESVAAALPLLYDSDYQTSSVVEDKDKIEIKNKVEANQPPNIKALQDEIKELKLQIIGKDQNIMNLRGTKEKSN